MQVREQSAWFWAAPEGGPSAADIRAWMGDFDAIRCVAKFTARMGQCFSSTVDTLKLQVRARVISLFCGVFFPFFCLLWGVPV